MGGSARWRGLPLASFVLNLFLLAVIGGHLLRARETGSPALLARALAAAENSLDANDAAAFRATLRAEAPRYAEAGVALARSRATLARTITAQPFDPAATRDALLVWRGDWLRFTDAFGGPLVDALTRISPDGRRKLVAERQRVAPPIKLP